MLYNKHNLAVAKIAAKDGHRDEIKGVFFTKDKTVATDSFRLLEIDIPKNDNPPEWAEKSMRGIKPFIVGAEMLKDKIKLGNEDLVAIKHVHDNRVEFLVGEDILPIMRIDGKYPDYESIFPRMGCLASIKINAKYLAETLEILGKLGGTTSEVTMKVFNNKMVVIEAGTLNQKGRGVVMGMQ